MGSTLSSERLVYPQSLIEEPVTINTLHMTKDLCYLHITLGTRPQHKKRHPSQIFL